MSSEERLEKFRPGRDGHEARKALRVPPPRGSVFDLFKEALPDVPMEAYQAVKDVVIEVSRGDVIRVLRTAKEDPRLDFRWLRCLSGVDYMDKGLEVVYHLHSYTRNHDVTVKVRCPQDDPRVPSATAVWRGADWYEREAAEMFGLVFEGHPNLVPLLLPEDMTDHHPLRKDNPLAEIEEWQGDRLAGPHQDTARARRSKE